VQAERKNELKKLIRSLHEGADLEAAKAKLKTILGGASSTEIARIEEELVA